MTTFVTNLEGVAIDGYDPVALHEEEAATRGSTDHETEWGGATWRFTSAEHRLRFEADPDRYAPVHGGRCSFGASLGRDADASPTAFRIIDDRLHLFRSRSVRALSMLFTGRLRRRLN